jgi:hypothetical protein
MLAYPAARRASVSPKLVPEVKSRRPGKTGTLKTSAARVGTRVHGEARSLPVSLHG